MLKEKIKSILLIVLSITMLSLVVSLWKINLNSNANEVHRADIFENVEDVRDFLSCLKIQVNFGAGNRTSFFYDKFHIFSQYSYKIANEIKTMSELESVQKEEYVQNGKYKSIEFEMPHSIQASYFVSILSEREVSIKEDFEFDKILFSVNDPNYLYFTNDVNYYKIRIKAKDELEKSLNAYLDTLKKSDDLIYYQSVADRFLIRTSNPNNNIDNVYIPRMRLPSIETYAIENLGNADLENQNVSKIAVNTFDARMSFVREVRDFDDSLILMYGYGDRILKISNQMDVSYSESIGNFVGYENNLIEDLKLAILSIRKLGYSKEDLKIYSIDRINFENQSGYEFKFFYRVNDFPVLNYNFKPFISAKIINSSVAGINMKLVKPSLEVVDLAHISDIPISEEQFFSILDNPENFDRFYNEYMLDLKANQEEEGKEESSGKPEEEENQPNNENLPKYQVVLGAIENFYISYALFEDKLAPHFVLQIGERFYVIDYYNFNIIN